MCEVVPFEWVSGCTEEEEGGGWDVRAGEGGRMGRRERGGRMVDEGGRMVSES